MLMSTGVSMTYSEEQMAELVKLVDRYAPQDGINLTSIPEVGTYRQTKREERRVLIYIPAIRIIAQGKKHCYLDGQKYDYSAGRYLCLFLPTPIEAETVDASSEKPFLMAGIKIDLLRIANILLKMERVKNPPLKSKTGKASVIVAESLTHDLLDAVIRLFRLLDNPLDQAVLSDSILDEVYFRLICNDHSESLQRLLRHRGQIQQISKAVDHIHHNLHEVISINNLAEMANMSTSSFRKAFKEIMHLPPLQYAKSIKLDHAYTLIKEGKNVNEAGYMVGYNSPAQFSREYKRHFGFAPSAT